MLKVPVVMLLQGEAGNRSSRRMEPLLTSTKCLAGHLKSLVKHLKSTGVWMLFSREFSEKHPGSDKGQPDISLFGDHQ